MLTDERLSELFQKWFQREGGDTYFDCWNACARAVEAEVLQAQEPAALDKLLNDFAITCAFGSADERVSAATAIKSLFAAPQPTAPCPKCAQYEIDFALEHDDKIALQAKVAEQIAEIERLTKERDEYKSAWQRAGEEYRKLRDSILALTGKFK